MPIIESFIHPPSLIVARLTSGVPAIAIAELM
jgi:hypothetical protein